MKTMKTSALGITVILLIITIGNYFRIIDHGNIRTVEFLAIWAIGALSGILIMQIISIIKGKTKEARKVE